MKWKIEFDDAFKVEFYEFPEAAQDAILAKAIVLGREGPS